MATIELLNIKPFYAVIGNIRTSLIPSFLVTCSGCVYFGTTTETSKAGFTHVDLFDYITGQLFTSFEVKTSKLFTGDFNYLLVSHISFSCQELPPEYYDSKSLNCSKSIFKLLEAPDAVYSSQVIP